MPLVTRIASQPAAATTLGSGYAHDRERADDVTPAPQGGDGANEEARRST
jgi:hypothetical protein